MATPRRAQAKGVRRAISKQATGRAISMMAAGGRKVVVGTDCSGMEAPIQALHNLLGPARVKHAFSCDVDAKCKQTVLANFPPKVFYDDITVRDNASAPSCDVYVIGFPCQPFSLQGARQGFKDAKGRGTIVEYAYDYIVTHKPKTFVLENVKGLINHDGGRTLKTILKELEGMRLYNIQYKVLNTLDHGVPQNRERIFIVGILKSVDKGTFEFPAPIKCQSIEKLLDPPTKFNPKTFLPPATSTHAHRNVKRWLALLKSRGSNPLKETWLVDCDSSTGRDCAHASKAPCMTRRRPSGFWITNRGRYTNLKEMMRLQGMTLKNFKQVVSDQQLGCQIGNSMSVNVLERLFVRLLPAAGLVRASQLTDRWTQKRGA